MRLIRGMSQIFPSETKELIRKIRYGHLLVWLLAFQTEKTNVIDEKET